MSKKQQIQQDLTEAMKAREELKSSVLRLLLAAILNKEKEKRYKLKEEKDVQLSDDEVLDAISSEIKKRKESVEMFAKGGRADLADKEKKEAEILQKYLPEQLGEEEVRKLVKEAVQKVGAKTQTDMSKVMGALTPQLRGKADMSLVSKMVKDLLTQ